MKRGVVSSVTRQQWIAAEIYPSPTNAQLTVTSQQAEQLSYSLSDKQTDQQHEINHRLIP